MAGQTNAAPVIIKRKKVSGGGGHHGGAWKVAYADFVTAMMAFFLLMWLLGATTEKQRKGVADYFSPAVPVSPTSGGGMGVFGGDSAFSEDDLISNGTPSAGQIESTSEAAEDENQAQAMESLQAEVERKLAALSGESMTMDNVLRHVVTKVTDEGLVIEIFDLEGVPLFAEDTAEAQPILKEITGVLAEVLQLARNQVAVNGHVRSYPSTLKQNPTWALSSDRATVVRELLLKGGFPDKRMQRTSGFADRKPVTTDPFAGRNNRIEIILLRRDR